MERTTDESLARLDYLSEIAWVSPEAKRAMTEILHQFPFFSKPLIGCSDDGGVGVEFRGGINELHVYINQDGVATAYACDSEAEWEGPLMNLPGGLEQWRERLSQPSPLPTGVSPEEARAIGYGEGHDQGMADAIRFRNQSLSSGGLGTPEARIEIRMRDLTMSKGKYAAQAVHAALELLGVHPGCPVVVLKGSKREVESMKVTIRDAGVTELEPGKLTAGASWTKGRTQE